MASMFNGATSLHQDLSKWNLCRIFHYNYVFQGAAKMTESLKPTPGECRPIYSNHTEPFTDRASLLTAVKDCIAQNSKDGCADMNTWDVTAVTDMSDLFNRNGNFNGNISKWNTSKVTNMQCMFKDTKAFNGDISGWDVSKVTNMGYMFSSASFNGDISKWDVSKVTNLRNMFFSASSFNGDISKWDVSKVTNMYGMFSSASSF